MAMVVDHELRSGLTSPDMATILRPQHPARSVQAALMAGVFLVSVREPSALEETTLWKWWASVGCWVSVAVILEKGEQIVARIRPLRPSPSSGRWLQSWVNALPEQQTGLEVSCHPQAGRGWGLVGLEERGVSVD